MTKKKISPAAAKVVTASARETSRKAPPAGPPNPAPAAEPPNPVEVQLRNYEQAVRLFGQRRLSEARDLFQQVARGPAPHIADKARSYVEVCERRSGARDLKLSTAEDHFNYGVERLNARDIAVAKEHLDRALAMQPDADHILYTLALCCGIAGDGDAAFENLKRAIELEPRNRVLARQDPEFSSLATQFPALRSLLSSAPSVSW